MRASLFHFQWQVPPLGSQSTTEAAMPADAPTIMALSPEDSILLDVATLEDAIQQAAASGNYEVIASLSSRRDECQLRLVTKAMIRVI